MSWEEQAEKNPAGCWLFTIKKFPTEQTLINLKYLKLLSAFLAVKNAVKLQNFCEFFIKYLYNKKHI